MIVSVAVPWSDALWLNVIVEVADNVAERDALCESVGESVTVLDAVKVCVGVGITVRVGDGKTERLFDASLVEDGVSDADSVKSGVVVAVLLCSLDNVMRLRVCEALEKVKLGDTPVIVVELVRVYGRVHVRVIVTRLEVLWVSVATSVCVWVGRTVPVRLTSLVKVRVKVATSVRVGVRIFVLVCVVNVICSVIETLRDLEAGCRVLESPRYLVCEKLSRIDLVTLTIKVTVV